jgi:hypothetical protein
MYTQYVNLCINGIVWPTLTNTMHRQSETRPWKIFSSIATCTDPQRLLHDLPSLK